MHILHFSGEVKIWDRFLEGSTESDEAFASRLLDVNTEFYSRLFIKQAGTEDEYRSHGLELVDGKFRCPLKKDPEAVGKTIERSVKQVRDAAFKATELWREDYESLLGVLQCTQEELLAKMQGVSCISSGMKFTCATDYGLTIWASAHEWTEVGKLSFGDEAIAHKLYLDLVPPLKNGLIEDLEAARDFLAHVKERIGDSKEMEYRAVIGTPANACSQAKENIRLAGTQLFDKVILIPEAFLAALGSRKESSGIDPVKNSIFVHLISLRN